MLSGPVLTAARPSASLLRASGLASRGLGRLWSAPGWRMSSQTRSLDEATAGGKGTAGGKTLSVWDQDKIEQRFPQLQEDVTADVCVIGAGIAGLTTAYLLAKQGKNVVVVDKTIVGGGQTGRTTAHIMQWNDDFFSEVLKKFPKEQAAMVARSHYASADQIAEIVNAESIACDFRWVSGYLFPHDESKKSHKMLEEELAACKELMMDDVEMVDLGGGLDVGRIHKALHFPHCANFHPLNYLAGLANAVTRLGGKIYERTKVSDWPNSDKAVTDLGHTIRATEAVVLATNSPLNQNLAVHSRQEPSRSYVVGLRVPEGSVRDVQFWDTFEPYHYVRLAERDNKTILMVGGGDHSVGIVPEKYPDAFGNLERWARLRWPQAEEVVFKWSGMVYEPVDFVGLYGLDPFVNKMHQLPKYIATGHSGQGMTGGTIAGMVISDKILGTDKITWSEVFNPERLKPIIHSVMEEASVVTMTTKGYVRRIAPTKAVDIKGMFSPNSVEAELQAGEGMTVQEGMMGPNRVALYKDTQGKIHKFSGICTHMGCSLEWNPVESTFDCPCHGSQFDHYGKCIQGPAIQDLEDLGEYVSKAA